MRFSNDALTKYINEEEETFANLILNKLFWAGTSADWFHMLIKSDLQLIILTT